MRLLQNYPPPGSFIRISVYISSRYFETSLYVIFLFLYTEDPGVRGRLNECLETILNKAQEPPKSKKVQHSNAKNAVLFEAISLIIHNDRYDFFYF